MKYKLSLIVIAALCITSASAMQFQTLGYKSVGMGGAGVASSSGSVATYNNPALLAKTTYDVEISLGGGISTYDHGAGASMQALDNSGFIDTMDRISNNIASLTVADKANLINGKDIVMAMDGNSVELAPQAYFAAQFSSFGMGVFGSSDVVGTAVVDQAYDQLIFTDDGTNYIHIDDNGNETISSAGAYTSSSIDYAVNNDLTYVQAIGIALSEVPVAYGHKFELSGGNLMLGGAAKFMQAITYTETLSIDNSGSSDNKNDKTSTDFGLDLGLAYEPSFAKELTIAVVAKNLNSPEFEFTNGSTVKIDPMIRAGVAYNILDSLEFAADIDLTENETFVGDVKSQMLGGGLSYQPSSWFSVRGGLMTNLDSNDKAEMIYTAGLGLGLKWLQVDLSAQMSQNSTTVDGESYPQYAKVNLALISRW